MNCNFGERCSFHLALKKVMSNELSRLSRASEWESSKVHKTLFEPRVLQVIDLISELIFKEALDLVLRCLNYRVYHLHKSWTR